MKRSKEFRERRKIIQKELWKNPKYKEHMVKVHKEKWKEKDYRKHMSEVHKGQISTKKNKTYKEIYGEDKAKDIIKKMSKPRNWVSNKKGKTHKQLYGKKKAEELRKKSSELRKGKHYSVKTELKKGLVPWWKKRGLENPTKKEHIKEKIRDFRKTQVLPIKDTKIEVKIQNFLKQLNIEFFTHQHIKEIEHSYQCDILIPSMNLVIECDGDYWHKYPIGKDIDHIRTKELIEKGFKILRLWEREIKEMSVEVFKERLYEN